jgi:phosphatidate cytidylyltransferase
MYEAMTNWLLTRVGLPLAGFPLGEFPLAQTGPTYLDARTNILLGTVLIVLIVAFVVGRLLRRQPESTASPAAVHTFNNRVQAWWLMYAVLIAGFIFGYVATVVLFGLVSFWALREIITMTPTRRGDHRILFWTFFIFTPAQYFLIGWGREAYGIYTVMIPVYASLFIPSRIAFSGDPKRFLERVAKIQAGLLICVYALSHAPALLHLNLKPSDTPAAAIAPAAPTPAAPAAAASSPAVTAEKSATAPVAAKTQSPSDAESENAPPATAPPAAAAPAAAAPAVTQSQRFGSNAGLLFYFILIVQLNDVFQYVWGHLLGRHVIAPQINASRTWEGFIGGILSTMLVGTLLCWATPFKAWEAACIAGIVAIMGFAGSMTMSGIKRDRGVKDYGTLVSGHAGVLDRIDSICFAAPVFFHIVSYFFSVWP